MAQLSTTRRAGGMMQAPRLIFPLITVSKPSLNELLAAGKEVSSYLQTDDTGARHKGNNGYCTYIGNDLFAWFESTESKSRVNFLDLLRAEHKDYVVNAGALEYMQQQGLPKA